MTAPLLFEGSGPDCGNCKEESPCKYGVINMSILLNKKALVEQLLATLAKDVSDENYFVRINDLTYMQYDAIEITPSPHMLTIAFIWRNTEVYCVSEYFTYGHNNTLRVSGIEGKMKFDLF